MLPSLSSLEEKRCLKAPEAGDSPALHGGSHPCLKLPLRSLGWFTPGLDRLPRMHQVPVSTRGREISDQNRTGPSGTLASSQQQAARALALLLLRVFPLRVPKVLPFFLVPFSPLLRKVRPSEQESRKISGSCMTLGY